MFVAYAKFQFTPVISSPLTAPSPSSRPRCRNLVLPSSPLGLPPLTRRSYPIRIQPQTRVKANRPYPPFRLHRPIHPHSPRLDPTPLPCASRSLTLLVALSTSLNPIDRPRWDTGTATFHFSNHRPKHLIRIPITLPTLRRTGIPNKYKRKRIRNRHMLDMDTDIPVPRA